MLASVCSHSGLQMRIFLAQIQKEHFMKSLLIKSTNFKIMRKKTSLLLSALVVLLSLQSFATTYYSRTTGGNWNVNSTWSTVNYGNSTNTGTYPKVGDIAFIGDGYAININTTVNCATIVVGEGRSGALNFLPTGNYIVNVSGNISVSRGAKFQYNNATPATHTCIVSGNLTNNGTVDFFYIPGSIVNLIFNGNSNSSVGGTGTWDLNDVTISKATSTDNYVSVNTSTFETAIKNLSVTYGTYIHNNSGSYTVNPSSNFTIGPNVKFKVPTGSMWLASTGTLVTLQGSLYVTGGTVTIGSNTGLDGLLSDQNGATVPYLEVTSGTLNVYGGISHASGSALDPLRFNMTGGTINTNTGTSGSNEHLFCVNDVDSSSFNMSGGTITFEKPNTGGLTNFDVGICGTNGIVTTTGGTFQFGTPATPTGRYFSFVPFPSATYPHFHVTGAPGSIVTLGTSVNSTVNFRLLSLNIDANKAFDILSVAGIGGTSKYMTLLSTVPTTTNGFVNNGTFYQRFSRVIFNGSTAQNIAGSTTTTFYQISINNPGHVTLNSPINVTSYVYLVNGKLITDNTNILTCMANANCDLGSSSTFVEGPMVHTVATSVLITKTYPFGKNGIHRPAVFTVKHATTTPVTYRAEIFNSPAGALPFSLPPTISAVSYVRYIKFIRSAVANFTNGSIQMYYGSDDAVLDYASLQVAQDDAISLWRNLGGTATSNGVGNITSSTFTSFTNYFALANPPGGNNPLPISLTAFTAKQNTNKTVTVNWSTAAEVNCDHYTVERSSDNKNFKPVATVRGNGNSPTSICYSTIDEAPLKGVSYYRLRQADYNGKEEVYPPVSVNFSTKNTMNVYPTISNGKDIHITNSENDLDSYSIAVQSMNGHIVPATVYSGADGLQISIDDTYASREGMYIITAVRGDEILRDKVIVKNN
jgi:hypothetical protein